MFRWLPIRIPTRGRIKCFFAGGTSGSFPSLWSQWHWLHHSCRISTCDDQSRRPWKKLEVFHQGFWGNSRHYPDWQYWRLRITSWDTFGMITFWTDCFRLFQDCIRISEIVWMIVTCCKSAWPRTLCSNLCTFCTFTAWLQLSVRRSVIGSRHGPNRSIEAAQSCLCYTTSRCGSYGRQT